MSTDHLPSVLRLARTPLAIATGARAVKSPTVAVALALPLALLLLAATALQAAA